MNEIPKTYNPNEVEDKWYSHWLDNECFTPDVDSEKKPYCITIPPPNVTGVLTMGHVLNNTIQDILARYHRQRNYNVLWLPGTDHAGIATQTKVERALKDEGKSKDDLGREKFLERAIEWRDKHGGIILKQLRKLGCSCDWSRGVHTLDDDYSNAVLKAFVDLYKRDYIYRGVRMVNWCPASLTALSDEEVIMKPQKSFLYKMKYELVDHPGEYLEIATTRPETIMGDAAVAIHPEDKRYKKYHGQKIWRPFPKAQIPIITDKAVDIEFGTGVLKVTPAHDMLDFEIGQRNNLPVIVVIGPDGKLNDAAGEKFAGMDRFKARKVAVKELEAMGLLISEENYENNVGFSERADVPIEPRLSEQWFLKYPKVEEAKRAVKEGVINFYPERWTKTYLHWLENIQDWCISRQLWWGHRIPVWYKKGTDRSDPKNHHISIEGPSDPENWEQDEDVLDTWASSWLWPLATLGWPEKDAIEKKGLHLFYPTNALVTGPDIIFFWVARMIMAGLEFMPSDQDYNKSTSDSKLDIEEIKKRIPFKDVYFTGIIRDTKGRKMSKSLGNSPDPLDLIEKFGADGLRFGIMSMAPKGQDIRFNEDGITQGRNFCTKLWNVCRFRQMGGEQSDNRSLNSILKRIDSSKLDADDHAILDKLVNTVKAIQNDMDRYEFNLATQHIYAFFWGDFCDWYIEISKIKMLDESAKEHCLAIQDLCLRFILLLLHPFTPFITEEIWQLLGYGKTEKDVIQDTNTESAETLIASLKENDILIDKAASNEIEQVRELVSLIRALKASHNLASKRDCQVQVKATKEQAATISSHSTKIMKTAGLKSLACVETEVQNAPAEVTPLGTAYLDLAASIDKVAERKKYEAEVKNLNAHIASSKARLSNKSFTDKAPEKVVEGAKKQLKEMETKLDEIESLLNIL